MKFYFLLIILILRVSYSWAIDTKAEQAIVIDFATNEVLFEKNPDQRVPPASMTKIMTSYVVFDSLKNTDLSIEDTCIITPKAYRMGGSRTFLEIDEQVSINDLLRGIIIQSGNDASIAIAECLAGTEEDFAILMNAYAKNIGMKNTNFLNASGWPDDNHYSTVRDLGILSNFLIRDFPNLYTYFNEKEFTYNNIKQPNRNKLLSKVVGADGLKTGYVKSSGFGIAGSAIRNERRITVVINGTNSSRSRLNESSNLLNWAFTQTSPVKLVSKNQIINNVDVWLGNHPTVNLIIKNDIVSILSFEQSKLIKTTINYEKPVSAPFKAEDELGSMTINIKGKPTIIVPLVAEKTVHSVNPVMKIFAAIKYLIFGTSLDEI